LYGAGAVVALLLALHAAARWDLWLMARHAVPFGAADPILGRDVSFYIFRLPFLQFVQTLLFMTTLVAAVAVGAVHAAGQSLVLHPAQGLMVSDAARRHLSWLAAVLLLLLGQRLVGIRAC
jgi:uncharacterized membrane protein (UPF0182 family)